MFRASSSADDHLSTSHVADHRIPVAGGEITARVFTPSANGTLPGLVHFHGGGFTLGTVDSFFSDVRCAHISAEAGCVLVTVDYRLAPEHRFPTAFEDCYAGLAWVSAHASSLRIDPARIAVAGESAGGNLAAAVALAARDRGGPPLVFQLLEVPVTDLTSSAAESASFSQFGQGFGLDSGIQDAMTSAYLARASDADSPYASPLHAGDLAGLPRTHVMTAAMDILRDGGEAYARRLRDAGVDVTAHRLEGHTHGSAVLWQTWEPARRWMDEVTDVLRRAVAG
jgi:acetyl esterase